MSDPGRPLGRRAVLGLVALAAATVALGGEVPAALRRVLEAPLQDLAPGDGFHFYSVTASIPSWSRASWRLRVEGLVERPLELALAEIERLPATEVRAAFHCVSGWSVPGCRWRGVRVSDLLDLAGASTAARAVRFESADGAYADGLELGVARLPDVLLALELNGRPLTAERGAPLRLVVPGYYGYKSVKWVRRLSLAPSMEPGYWEVRGYDADARIRS